MVTLKEKISQLFICKTPDTFSEIELFVREGIGGLMLGKGGEPDSFIEGNSVKTLKRFVQKINNISKKNHRNKLFVAIDGEGGDYFNRFTDFSTYKSPRFYGKKFETNSNIKSFQKEVLKFAKLMKKIGANMNFAPLIDVANLKYTGYLSKEKTKFKDENLTKSEIISSDRSYSDNRETVCTLAINAMKIFQKNKIIPVLKHFPSYGILETNQNPHFVLSKSNLAKKEILNHVENYREAINSGLDAIMTGHVVTAIDSKKPASVSLKNYNLIRKDLKFDGIVISDELNMNSIRKFYKNSLERIAIEALRCNDILLISHPSSFIIMRDTILKKAKIDKNIKNIVEDRYKRVLKIKKLI